MEGSGIWVSAKALTKHQVIERCRLGQLTNQEAAETLNLSARQVQRLKKNVRDEGIAGVVHGNQGRSPTNKLSAEVYAQITELIQGKWSGLNSLHVRDKLKEDYGITIGRETLRRLFKRLSIPLRKHRRKKRFSRRERKPMAGMLIQMDGSPHDWFLTGDPCVLLGAIDDATGEVLWAKFVDSETTLNYLSLLEQIVKRKGIFWAVYVDKHSCFKTIRRDWNNHKTFRRMNFDDTQVARALGEMGIEMINANSPQAKGRIERLWETFQDRLIQEMRLRNIKDKETGNCFLEEFWLADYNQKFMKLPAVSEPAYRPMPEGVNLREIFCVKFDRLVKNDHTVSYAGRLYKILEDPYRASYAKATVEVRVYPDSGLSIAHRGRLLNVQPIEEVKPAKSEH